MAYWFNSARASSGDAWVSTPAFVASYTHNVPDGPDTVVMTLTGNLTVNAPTGAVPGARLRFVFLQDATGSRTVTFNAAFKKNFTVTATASQYSVVEFLYTGTAWVQVDSINAVA